jgi:prohibitin 1
VPNSSSKKYVAFDAISLSISYLLVYNQAEQERQAAVIRAEGEAEAAAVISRALDRAGEAFVTFRKIEAAKAIVQSLSQNRNVSYIPGGGDGGSGILLNVPTQ